MLSVVVNHGGNYVVCVCRNLAADITPDELQLLAFSVFVACPAIGVPIAKRRTKSSIDGRTIDVADYTTAPYVSLVFSHICNAVPYLMRHH